MTQAACEECGADLSEARPNAGLDSPARIRIGRPPRFCSAACRMRAHRAGRAARPEVAQVQQAADALARAAKRLAQAASAHPPDADTARRISATLNTQAQELTYLARTLES